MNTLAMQPELVLAIILGASKWPRFTKLEGGESFKNTALGFRKYLEEIIGLRQQNLLWLFDAEEEHPAIDERIRVFLKDRVKAIGIPGSQNAGLGDVFLFFTGHGRLTNDGRLQLVLSSTNRDAMDNSAYRMHALSAAMNDHVQLFRRWVFLDCCFSGQAHEPLMPQSFNEDSLREEVRILPPWGTALYAACLGNEVARAPRDKTLTMFGSGLLNVLDNGAPQFGELMTLDEIDGLVKQKILEDHLDKAVKPVLSVPDPSQGTITRVPFFPNRAKRRSGNGEKMEVILSRLDLIVQQQSLLHGQVQNMMDHLTCPRMDLEASQDDFISQLSHLNGSWPVRIRHIGLDMFRAQHKMTKMLEEHFTVKEGDLNVLVISHNPREFKVNLPPAIQTMVGRVKQSVDEFIHSLTHDVHQLYRERGQHLTVEIRRYKELPTIHGFALSEGQAGVQNQRHIATYFSFCRWNKTGHDIKWAGLYRRILGQPNDFSSRDMQEIFDDAFVHLWKNSERRFRKVIG
jgi:hypothetical protein